MFYNPYFYFMPKIPDINNNPPTLYSILNSIANYGKEDKTAIKDLASMTHTDVFDFTYPLSEKVDKAEFETLFLNRFLMRRIGFETFTAFQLNLNVKLNMIMPKYNILFDSIIDWDILNDKEITDRIGSDKTNFDSDNKVLNSSNSNSLSNTVSNTSTESETSSTNDRRFSNLPENQISNISDGNYMTEYTLEQNSGTDSSTSSGNSNSDSTVYNSSESNSNTKNEENKNYNEKTTKTLSPYEKFTIYNEMQKNLMNIYEMIFNELNDLFYSIIN